MKLISKPMLLSLCLIGFVLSVALNIFLLYQVKYYYSENKLGRVFPNHEIAFKAENLKLLSKAKEKTRVVLFGDSRIDQWQPLPVNKKIDFVNRGIGGETTVQLKHRMLQDAINLKPDFVVLEIGINDLVAIGIAPNDEYQIINQTIKNINRMVNQLLDQDIFVILLTIISPSKPSLMRLPVWSQRITTAVKEINAQILNLSPKDKLHVINADLVLSSSDKELNHVYADTLHLSTQGYQKLNVVIQKFLSNQ